MRSILSILFLLISCLNHLAISQVNDEQAYLMGKHDKLFIKTNRIQSIKVETSIAGNIIRKVHSFDTTGNLIYTATLDKAGRKVNESYFKFNSFGAVTDDKYIDHVMKTYDSSNYQRVYIGSKQIDESSQQVGYSKEYFFNEKGQVEKTITTNDHGTTTITLHVYDTTGNEVEELWIQNEAKKITRNTYDNQGKLIEFQTHYYEPFDTIGKLFLHKHFTYNNMGRIASEQFIGGYFYFDKDTREYIYDNKGNLVLIKSGKEKQQFRYDERGFLVMKETPFLGKIKSVEKYTYVLKK